MFNDTNTVSTKRRSKGEQTRIRILEACHETIAELGLRGVTHREVARRAEVQLSLTTYYFRDIDELIREAFALFCEQSRPGYQQLWTGVFDYLESFSRADLRRTAVREHVCQYLADIGTDYLVAQVMEKPIRLAVEQTLFTAARHTPPLLELATQHRDNLLQPLIALCRQFNSRDPEVDAELLLDVMTTLEYSALFTPVDELNPGRINQLMRRQLGWILGLKRA